MNFTTQHPIVIKSTLKKFFIDGLMLKLQIAVRMLETNTTITYELLAFWSMYEHKPKIWHVAVVLPHF